MLGLLLQRLDVRICDHLTCHARALTCVFSPQVCFGAVQRSVLAHVQSGHPGPHLLPSRPLCGAHSVVQCHHEYTLMEKHLPSGSVPSPAASVTEPAARPLPETTAQPALWLLRRHVLSLQCSLQSDSRTLPHGPGNVHSSDSSRVWCGHPRPLARGKFRLVVVFRRKTEETVSFCTQESVFSVSV